MDNKLLIQDLAEALSSKEGLTKKKSEAFIKTLFETVEEGLIADKFVKIKGLGTFKIISVGERESVNINTGERFSIEGHDKITFTPDNLLKDLINRPFSQFQTVILNEETDMEELENVGEELEEASKETERTENNSDRPAIDPDKQNNNKADTDFVEISLDTESEDNLQESDKNEKDSVSLDKTENKASTSSVGSEEKCLDKPLQQDKAGSDLSDNESSETSEDKENETFKIGSNLENQQEKNQEKNLSEQQISSHTPQPERIISEEQFEDESDLSINTTREQIKYVIKEHRDKKNIWKTTSIVLFTILILIITYFAGYFRVFCPCEWLHISDTTSITPILNEADMPYVPLEDSTNLQEQLEVVETDSIICFNNNEETKDTTKENTLRRPQPSTPEQTGLEKAQKENSSADNLVKNEYEQVKGGKYSIIGTIKTHKIERGETIRTIALKEYGSKGYAIYIITHNNLNNPDNIDIGTIIKLPKLRKNT